MRYPPFAGAAPITRASSDTVTIVHRYIKNRRLAAACYPDEIFTGGRFRAVGQLGRAGDTAAYIPLTLGEVRRLLARLITVLRTRTSIN